MNCTSIACQHFSDRAEMCWRGGVETFDSTLSEVEAKLLVLLLGMTIMRFMNALYLCQLLVLDSCLGSPFSLRSFSRHKHKLSLVQKGPLQR